MIASLEKILIFKVILVKHARESIKSLAITAICDFYYFVRFYYLIVWFINDIN